MGTRLPDWSGIGSEWLAAIDRIDDHSLGSLAVPRSLPAINPEFELATCVDAEAVVFGEARFDGARPADAEVFGGRAFRPRLVDAEPETLVGAGDRGLAAEVEVGKDFAFRPVPFCAEALWRVVMVMSPR